MKIKRPESEIDTVRPIVSAITSGISLMLLATRSTHAGAIYIFIFIYIHSRHDARVSISLYPPPPPYPRRLLAAKLFAISWRLNCIQCNEGLDSSSTDEPSKNISGIDTPNVSHSNVMQSMYGLRKKEYKQKRHSSC